MSLLFNNTIVSTLETATVVVSSLIATPFLISGLGVDAYGVYVFLNMFTIYGALRLFDFGLEGSVLNHVARAAGRPGRESVREVFSAALIFYLAIALAISLVLQLTLPQLTMRFAQSTISQGQHDLMKGAAIMPLVVLVQFVTLAFSSVLEGLSKYHITRGTGIVLTLLQYASITTVAISTHSLFAVYGCVTLISALRLGIYSYFLLFADKNFAERKFSFSFDSARKLIKYSGILFVSRIIGFIFNHMDKFLIWKFLSPASMAIYDIVVRPASLLRIVVTVINSALIPEISRLDSSGKHEDIKSLFLNFVRLAYTLIIPLMIVLMINMRYLINLWVGPQFSVHYLLAFILLFVYAVNPIPAIASTIFVGKELARKTIPASIMGAAINLVLSILLVDRMGIMGLLIGTLTAELAMFIPFAIYCKKYIGASYMETVLPPIKVIGTYAPPFLVLWLLLLSIPPEIDFLCSMGALALAYLYAYHFILTPTERAFILAKVRGNTGTN